jgi:hypothetical protein
MRFAYADPPYFAQGRKLYGKHHAEAAVWDSKEEHIRLIERLVSEYPDGWALSANPADLRWLLPHTPEGTRVCSWVKTFHQIRPTTVQFAWEPVLLFGGRKDNKRSPMVRDWYIGVPTRKKGLPGAKSDAFNDWILDLLNYKEGDQVDDLFPGTRGMERATNRQGVWRMER